jgi:hypothetical protein
MFLALGCDYQPCVPDVIYVDTFNYASIDSAKKEALAEVIAFRDSIRNEFILWVEKTKGTKIYNNIVVSPDSMQQILCN